ncbi:hypothetical protein HU200_005635 [Digitaria exilis]|uniref:Peptidase S9 prolyl oligopeptidase catalytic domain-containing protein n=1 Tax=Digitaria exilis TaxID=1010633 RepID=A0A835KU71_9POAL|nr:hypothetical protein HU200_005635 [Digitaria exilis]
MLIIAAAVQCSWYSLKDDYIMIVVVMITKQLNALIVLVVKVERGKVDGQRLCITGRSAGGYTTLASLAFRNTFKAGASVYGVADLSLLKEETHKFEKHDLDHFVGKNVYNYLCSTKSGIRSRSDLMLFKPVPQEMKGLAMRDRQSTLLISLCVQ